MNTHQFMFGSSICVYLMLMNCINSIWAELYRTVNKNGHRATETKQNKCYRKHLTQTNIFLPYSWHYWLWLQITKLYFWCPLICIHHMQFCTRFQLFWQIFVCVKFNSWKSKILCVDCVFLYDIFQNEHEHTLYT